MVIDIAREFNKVKDTHGIESLCPVLNHIARCAQEHIMTCVDFEDMQWQQDLGELKALFKYFNRRWSSAGM